MDKADKSIKSKEPSYQSLEEFFKSLLRPVSINWTSGIIATNRKKRRRKARGFAGDPAGTKMARLCQSDSKRGFDGTLR